MIEPHGTSDRAPTIAGLVLAAGAGRRYGGPKALASTSDGTSWLRLAVEALCDAGCSPVWVALGAEAARAETLVPAGARIVRVEDWADGLSATIATALEAVCAEGAQAVLIVPVDTPDVPATALVRILREATDRPQGALVQATYGGVPGHPVLVGADHFAALQAALTTDLAGDRGARPYLAAHGVVEVECADLWSGEDVDEAPAV